jgi:raffinose/stachyose/melibiose transport system permease protein
VPFIFIFLTAMKTKSQASRLDFSWPTEWHLVDNLIQVLKTRDWMLLLAYFNSTVITVGAVALLVIFGAMIGYILQRRHSAWNRLIYACVLAGLMIPPAVVPTIWVLQELHVFKTLWGMVLIQVAYGLSFTVLLYRAFIATIPRDLDEAARIDGAGPLRTLVDVLAPLLRPALTAVLIISFIAHWDDFFGPLIYLNTPISFTLSIGVRYFYNTLQGEGLPTPHLLMAAATVATLPPVGLFLLGQRYFVQGVVMSGLKA